MSYGGLRGAVGFSLAQILDEDNPFKEMFLTATIFMVFFTVFIQGGTIKFLVDKLKIKKHEEGVSNLGSSNMTMIIICDEKLVSIFITRIFLTKKCCLI